MNTTIWKELITDKNHALNILLTYKMNTQTPKQNNIIMKMDIKIVWPDAHYLEANPVKSPRYLFLWFRS